MGCRRRSRRYGQCINSTWSCQRVHGWLLAFHCACFLLDRRMLAYCSYLITIVNRDGTIVRLTRLLSFNILWSIFGRLTEDVGSSSEIKLLKLGDLSDTHSALILLTKDRTTHHHCIFRCCKPASCALPRVQPSGPETPSSVSLRAGRDDPGALHRAQATARRRSCSRFRTIWPYPHRAASLQVHQT
jgi:hypothetical protein